MLKINKIISFSILFAIILYNISYAEAARIYTVINNDATTGPGVHYNFDNNPKNNIPNGISKTGPLGPIYLHNGKRYMKGKNLGEFKLTGYCSCKICSTGTGITYSGKHVTPNHTVAADLSILPIDTFIILEGSKGQTANYYDGVYQVEDKGGGVKDKHIDIYQPTHELAADVTRHGYNYANVYEAVPMDKEALDKEMLDEMNFFEKYEKENKNNE